MSFDFVWLPAVIVPWLIGAALAYGVIRLGVKHGILDADRQRTRDASNGRHFGPQGRHPAGLTGDSTSEKQPE
ncbi:hypothetical protein [Occultella gossypii]|uniref:Uncharacterized protein n=1 Tax=Occultella gossypii TaxID=2800820 RepID=A0ABS7SG12_9MICO|nr:hypothetical protein [Occultella gossypii]MBZ2198714.1 hypothetical protein [Occultella gossypii]